MTECSGTILLDLLMFGLTLTLLVGCGAVAARLIKWGRRG